MATAIAGGAPSVNVALRKTLDLYANLRPVKNLPGVKSRFEGVDVVLVRESSPRTCRFGDWSMKLFRAWWESLKNHY